MEFGTFVAEAVLACGQGAEILNGLGNSLGVEKEEEMLVAILKGKLSMIFGNSFTLPYNPITMRPRSLSPCLISK